jgi:hypothetical protein
MFTRKLTTTGNSTCIILDKTLKEVLNIKSKDDFINITIIKNKIIIEKGDK